MTAPTDRPRWEQRVWADACGERRPKTSARCELPDDHMTGSPPRYDSWHCGRDKAGRWHSWKVDL